MGQIGKVSGAALVYSLVKTAQPVNNQPATEQEKQDDPLVYSIPEWRMDYLMSKIEKLNKTAQKLGVEPIKVHVLGDEIQKVTKDGHTIDILLKKIRIEGHAPKLAGWTIAARILHTEEGNVIKATPDIGMIPPEYRTSKPFCEHCKTNRDRRDTFLVKNDQTNEIKQVGRNCLRDFLGHESPELYARFAENLSDLYTEAGSLEEEGSDGGGGGGSGPSSTPIESFLVSLAALRKVFGYLSRAKAKETEKTSTAEMAFDYSTNWRQAEEINKEAAKRGKQIAASEEDKTLVSNAIEWIRKLKEGSDANESLSDYLWNLAVACSQSVVTHKTMGIVGSLLSAYERSNNALPQGSSAGKGFVGELNKPISLKGTITAVRSGNSARGAWTMYALEDDQKNIIKWFDNSGGEKLQQGTQVAITGIVKNQKPYNGRPETELTGVRVVSEEEFDRLKAEQAVAADAAAKGQDPKKDAPPIPDEGKRVELELTLVDKKYIEVEDNFSRRGGTITKVLHMFVDEHGRNFKWFSSSGDLDTGNKYKVKATIGKQDVYNNVSSTMLSRVEVLQVGGEKAVTRKDINAKGKEVSVLQEKISGIHAQITEIINGIYQKARDSENETNIQLISWNPNTSYVKDFADVINKANEDFSANMQKLQAAIEQSKQAGKPVDVSTNNYMLNDRLGNFRRPPNPDEFLNSATPEFQKLESLWKELNNGLLDRWKQVNERFLELRRMRQDYGPEYNQLNQERTQLSNQINELIHKYHNEIIGYSSDIEKLPQLMPMLTQDIQNAQQAKAHGITEFTPKADWGYKIPKTINEKPSLENFLKDAEASLRLSASFRQQIDPQIQQILQIAKDLVPLKLQLEQKEQEFEQMQANKGRAKKASIEWVIKNCKFIKN